MNHIAILGAGSWGTALATLLPRENVTLWTLDQAVASSITDSRENRRYLPGVHLANNISVTSDLATALRGSKAVVFAIPSAGMADVSAKAALLIPNGALMVSAVKGLDDRTGMRMSEVIGAALEGVGRGSERSGIVALSGPNLAVEVAQGIPTATVAASEKIERSEACRDLFMGPTFRVYSSTDIVGVELAGAMKNVIAIAAGVCDGMGFGDNSRAALMTRGLAEITRLGLAMGAQHATFLGLAGVGDLIATGGSRLSRNYRVGYGLGQGKSLDDVLEDIGQVAEGVPTTRAICSLSQRLNVEMPISDVMYRALFEGSDLRKELKQLMLRPAKHEV